MIWISIFLNSFVCSVQPRRDLVTSSSRQREGRARGEGCYRQPMTRSDSVSVIFFDSSTSTRVTRYFQNKLPLQPFKDTLIARKIQLKPDENEHNEIFFFIFSEISCFRDTYTEFPIFHRNQYSVLIAPKKILTLLVSGVRVCRADTGRVPLWRFSSEIKLNHQNLRINRKIE